MRSAIAVWGLLLVAASPAPTATPSRYRGHWDDPVQSAAYGAPGSRSRTGAALDGFALSLTFNAYTLHFNDAVEATIELRNVSSASNTSDLGSPGSTYTIILYNQTTGVRRTFSYQARFRAPKDYLFAPDTALRVRLAFEASLSWFNDVGTYAVQAQIAGANAAKPLRSEVVAVTVLPAHHQPPYFSPGDPSARTPIGTPQHDLALSLTAPASPVYFDDPISVGLELRNLSPKERQIILGARPYFYDFAIVDEATGRVVPPVPGGPHMSAVTGPLGSPTLLGERSEYSTYRLDKLYQFTGPGTYSVKVADAEMNVDGNAPVSLQSNAITLHLLPLGPPTAAQRSTSGLYEDAAPNSPAGAAAHGFALSLASDVLTAHVGAPLDVTVELRNTSGEPQYASFGSRQSDYHFTVVSRETGPLASNLRNSVGSDRSSGKWSATPLYPGTSLYATFRLDSLYRFSRPGTYTVRVEGRPVINGVRLTLQSNPIAITLR